MRGFLVVDKPVGISSHHVVAIMRAVLGKPKIGHTGTLDPFADGVLVLAIGTYTRLISFLPEKEKGYLATLRLGEQSKTGDTEGEIIARKIVPNHSKDAIQHVLTSMKGAQEQVPPQFSAVKHKGKPLYTYARKGQVIELKPRPIHIYELELQDRNQEEVIFSAVVSRGTYVRQLGEEIANRLDTVGHLTSLRREKSGDFCIAQSITLDEVSWLTTGLRGWKETLSKEGKEKYTRCSPQELWSKLQPKILSVEEVFASFPRSEVSQDRANKIKNGLPPYTIPSDVEPDTLFWFCHQKTFLALAKHDGENIRLLRVLN